MNSFTIMTFANSSSKNVPIRLLKTDDFRLLALAVRVSKNMGLEYFVTKISGDCEWQHETLTYALYFKAERADLELFYSIIKLNMPKDIFEIKNEYSLSLIA